MKREDVPYLVSNALGGRPVRWAPDEVTIGDYDGRERTLEVFLVNVAERRDLMAALRPLRHEIDTAAGGPVVIIFHSTRESHRLYADFLWQFDAPVLRASPSTAT